MRSSFRLPYRLAGIAAIGILAVCALAPGEAQADVRTTSATDPVDAYATFDIASITATSDNTAGMVRVEVGFHSPVPTNSVGLPAPQMSLRFRLYKGPYYLNVVMPGACGGTSSGSVGDVYFKLDLDYYSGGREYTVSRVSFGDYSVNTIHPVWNASRTSVVVSISDPLLTLSDHWCVAGYGDGRRVADPTIPNGRDSITDSVVSFFPGFPPVQPTPTPAPTPTPPATPTRILPDPSVPTPACTASEMPPDALAGLAKEAFGEQSSSSFPTVSIPTKVVANRTVQAQAKLLRARNRSFAERSGGTDPLPLDPNDQTIVSLESTTDKPVSHPYSRTYPPDLRPSDGLEPDGVDYQLEVPVAMREGDDPIVIAQTSSIDKGPEIGSRWPYTVHAACRYTVRSHPIKVLPNEVKLTRRPAVTGGSGVHILFNKSSCGGSSVFAVSASSGGKTVKQTTRDCAFRDVKAVGRKTGITITSTQWGADDPSVKYIIAVKPKRAAYKRTVRFVASYGAKRVTAGSFIAERRYYPGRWYMRSTSYSYTRRIFSDTNWDEYWNYCIRKFRDVRSSGGRFFCTKRAWSSGTSKRTWSPAYYGDQKIRRLVIASAH